MKAPSGIVCLEGADASGKTTLARYLVDRCGARYLHGRVWKDMCRWHAGMLRRAERLVTANFLVCIDRMWISELIYGPIFRGGAAYSNETAAEFDNRITVSPGVYVLCVPSRMREHLARFERLKSERREEFDRIEAVVQRYRDLLEGNVAHPGGNLVDLFIRFGDFVDPPRRVVVHHDIDNSAHTIERTARRVIQSLKELR